MKPLRILIVDNEPNVLEVMRLGLKMRGLEADTAENGQQALEIMQKNVYDVVLLDLIMPEMNGVEVLQQMKKQGSNAKVIILTGYPSHEAIDEALDEGAVAYILKPSSPDKIYEAILAAAQT